MHVPPSTIIEVALLPPAQGDQNMRKVMVSGLAMLLAIVFLGACRSPQGGTVSEKQAAVQKMRADTLESLYRIHPAARDRIKAAGGYAVFSNIGTNVLLLSTGNGYGIARDNKTGGETYMKMLSLGVGIGIGVKDFRGVFVFANQGALNDFIEKGWDASGQADAAAKLGNEGGAAAGALTVAPGVDLYQITEAGLAIQATIQGTKYSKDDELNGVAPK